MSATVAGAVLAYACAAADGALLSLDPDDGTLSLRLLALYQRRERAHRALAFARVAAHATAGVGIALALGLPNRSSAGAFWQGALAALLTVLASESIARSRGSLGGSAYAEMAYPFVAAMERLLAPIALLGEWLDASLRLLLPEPPRDDEDIEETAEQFKQVVASEAEASREQVVLLNGVFRLGQTAVHELMVPRVDIVAIDRDAPWSEVLDRMRSSEHARIPVFRETIDDVQGVLLAKDVLPYLVADEVPDDWTSLMRPPVFIPAGKSADVQLREFQATGAHIAIVADEFGGTAGLITIEDVLEEIVGDISDEHDDDAPRAESEDGRRYWVPGRMTLDELSDLVRADLRHEEVSTLGGLVYELLGRVPRAGEELEFRGYRLIIERVVRRRVARVFLERVGQPGDDGHLQDIA